MTTPPAGDAREVYRAREARYAEIAAREAARSRRYSRARLALAIAGLAAFLTWASGAGPWALPLLPGIATAFLVLVIRHDRVERLREAADVAATLNREALHRIDRDWDALPQPWSAPGIDDHPYAPDLDLFGHASLAQILGPVRTPAGRALLSRWLLDIADADRAAIASRQEAVRELAPQLDFRQQFAGLARHVPAVHTRDADVDAPELGRFVTWAEEPSWLTGRAWILAVALLLGGLTTFFTIAWFAGWMVNPWWLATATLGWILRWRVHAPLEPTFAGASGEHGLRSWNALIALVTGAAFSCAELRTAQAALAGRHGHAHAALRRLEQLVALADLRLSTWLYLPIQTLTLWDIHVWWALERWRRTHGSDVRYWFGAVARIEALSALASLAHDHPSWAFPTFTDAAVIAAEDLGHPLLADAVRVTNDVRIGPPGRFLLITGSNMSGKSTLLRAAGLNVVLAHAGAPVCATRMSLPLVSLHTSMRVADSLERGLSLFMASLVRLERIVHAARHATRERPVCYLLDEVLQGTNSAERQIAVRTVVEHLLACHAIGAVTTHDLELARDPEFSAAADSFHLQETLSGEGDAVTMTFDYRLRPGPAQAGNALQLLRMLGLGAPQRSEPAPPEIGADDQ
ncbi:MAG TPA: hypothetical protein VIL35_11175 [Vicinamibacterales bacterium]